MENEKRFVLGQYFTKKKIVDKVISLLFRYKFYNKEIKILEPSSGTRNFIKGLNENGFSNIQECEIDESLTNSSCDFFLYPIENKFDLIIGNPPFTKYNLKNSYYHPNKYKEGKIKLPKYLPLSLLKKEKFQIENAFILKSIQHLKNEDSSIGFVLPISFFIAKKNKEIKKEIMNRFSTIIIYQNDENWFDIPIPCCFAIFTNIKEYKDKIILLYEYGGNVEEYLDISALLTEELIPKSFLYKKNNKQIGKPLSNFLLNKSVKYKLSYEENNISGKNILNKTKIPERENIEDYCLAITRVGNSSVGKSGLINPKKDILNGMFFVFEFKEEYNHDKEIKEKICFLINKNQEHFKNITQRVGSKSIKRGDVLEFRIQEH